MHQMKYHGLILLLLTIVTCTSAFGEDLYDPEADPFEDLDSALISARENNKNVIVQIGGNWCRWTRALDALYESDKKINVLIRDNYEFVRVNYSDENRNEEFISTLGETNGIPFIFILNSAGKLLHARETESLELGNGHDPEKVFQFFEQWK